MRPSPNDRHLNARRRADRERKRKRALRVREQEQRQQEREQRATPSPPRCVCVPGFCVGVPGESDACTACVTLDPELPCLRAEQ